MRRKMMIDDWERAGGINCPKCHQEVVRIINGLCPQCHHAREKADAEQVEDKTMRRYYKRGLRRGTISLGQMREGGL